LVRAIFEAAKRSNRTLSEAEVHEIVRKTPAGAAA
jgi:hypothetical protein